MRYELKDVIKMYVGCDAINITNHVPIQRKITGIHEIKNSIKVFFLKEDEDWCWDWIDNVAPILRPLSDMTEEECRELVRIRNTYFPYTIGRIDIHLNEPKRIVKYGSGVRYSMFKEDGSHLATGTISFTNMESGQFYYLLQRGFDLFGGIEAGWAIDKTKLS